MTLIIELLNVTLSMNDNPPAFMLSAILLSIAFYLLLCQYAECHSAECRYAECRSDTDRD
jgi:hypothetical protein